MIAFDPMAAAMDWLDAYRARDLSIGDLYASDAILDCGCKGRITIVGRTALIEYWRRQFDEKPAGALKELSTDGDWIVVSYAVPDGMVQASLKFNSFGEIVRTQWGPLRMTKQSERVTLEQLFDPDLQARYAEILDLRARIKDAVSARNKWPRFES